MDRAQAAARVLAARHKLARSTINPAVRSDGTIFLFGHDNVDEFTGQQAFDGLAELLDVFELTEPIDGVSLRALRAPSLVHPSTFTYISPWVAGGEPCIVESRVPTAAIYALRSDRGLEASAIQRLYSHLDLEAIEDALELEEALRAA